MHNTKVKLRKQYHLQYHKKEKKLAMIKLYIMWKSVKHSKIFRKL